MLIKGRYQLREAVTTADMRAALALRLNCFGRAGSDDADPLDSRCMQMLIHEHDSGELVCCFRLLPLAGATLGQSYAAQFYDLSNLASYPGKMMEMGRFCIDPTRRDPDILRLAWAAMTDQVDQQGIELLLGCSSFEGVEPSRYLEAFALLEAQHSAPQSWQIGEGASEVFRFRGNVPEKVDQKAALCDMPSLLRTYLMMGGWVSDHAVIDRELNTMHVFTGVEISAIPPARKRLLRALI